MKAWHLKIKGLITSRVLKVKIKFVLCGVKEWECKWDEKGGFWVLWMNYSLINDLVTTFWRQIVLHGDDSEESST